MNRDFLAALVDELLRLVRPVREALESSQQFANFLEGHGWVIPSGNLNITAARNSFQIAADLTTVAQLLAQIATAPEGSLPLGKYIDAVDKLQAVIVRLQGLGVVSAPAGVPSAAWSQVGQELPERLIAEYLEAYRPATLAVLLAFGVVEEEWVDLSNTPGRTSYLRRHVAWDRLPQMISDPSDLVSKVFGWRGSQGLDFPLLLAQLERALSLLGLAASLEAPASSLLDEYYAQTSQHRLQARLLRFPLITDDLQAPSFQVGLWLLPIPPSTDKSAAPDGLALSHFLTAPASPPEIVSWPYSIEYSGAFQSDGLVRLELHPGDFKAKLNTSGTRADALATIYPSHRRVLLGSPMSNALFGLPRLSVGIAGTPQDPEILLGAGLADGRVAIDIGDGDGFLQKVLGSEPQSFEFDCAITWSSKTGLTFSGRGVLTLTIPINKDLWVLTVETLTISLGGSADGAVLALGVTANVKLGPVTAAVEDIGVKLTLAPVKQGQPPGLLGDLDLVFGFKPPKGTGLAIAGGPVKGGGYLFFDARNEQYAGVLQLEFKALSLTAVGLLTTRMPDGSKGFSLLLIITAEFASIQLGFGFTLNGVGGLIGVNRSVVKEALQAGLKTGALGSILFPKNPVENAPQLLSDLRTVFPPAPSSFVFGPMAKLGWGTPTLLTLELGVILQFPSPLRLIILGRLSMALPTREAAILSVNLEVLGIIDFDEGEASIDARLYDSRLVNFVLTGEMAARLGWAKTPHFELAAGGFNPRFQPPATFPRLERLALSLAAGDNPRLRLECYFALTSNTLQFGAHLDFHVHVDLWILGIFSVDAHLGFDVLIRFVPFQIEADIAASIDLKRNGKSFLGVWLDLHLKGPGPWHAWGQASFEFLGRHSIGLDITIGPAAPPAELPESKPLELLLAALADQGNWSAQLPGEGQMLVTLRELEPAKGEVLMHPLGELTVRQRVVPLKVEIQKFGETRPVGPRRFEITAVALAGVAADDRTDPVREYFAAAQFLELSDPLSRPGFEAFEAGKRIGTSGVDYPAAAETTFGYEDIVIDVEPNTGLKQRRPGKVKTYKPTDGLLAALAAAGSLDTFAADGYDVALEEPVYVVAGTRDLKLSSAVGVTRGDGLTYTEADQELQRHIADNPADEGETQVVGAHEAVPV